MPTFTEDVSFALYGSAVSTIAASFAYPREIGRVQIREGVSISDTSDIDPTARPTPREVARALSFAYPGARALVDVTETLSIDDIVSATENGLNVRESLLVDDSTTLLRTTRTDVREVLTATGGESLRNVEDVTDAFVASDSSIYRVRLQVDVRDQLEASTVAFAIDLARADVREVAVATSTATPLGTYTLDIREELFISDEAILGFSFDAPLPADSVWTANVVNWAMSRYAPTRLSSALGGFAASPTGLFVQADMFADMTLLTGAHDFGVPEMKTIRAVYTYGRHDAVLTYTVEADFQSLEEQYVYAEEPRPADDFRATRTLFGRGLKSNYFQVKMDTTGYADLLQVVPRVEALSRRI